MCLLRRICSPIRDENLNFLALDTDLKRLGSYVGFRIIQPGSGLHAKLPGVPGTNHTTSVEVSFGQRRSHVRTKIIDRKVPVVPMENGNSFAFDGKNTSFTGRNFPHFRHLNKLSHSTRPVLSEIWHCDVAPRSSFTMASDWENINYDFDLERFQRLWEITAPAVQMVSL